MGDVFIISGIFKFWGMILIKTILFYSIVSGSFLSSGYKLKVTNDGPATLDSTISFTATLEGNAVNDSATYEFIFKDKVQGEYTIYGTNNATLKRIYTYDDVRSFIPPWKLGMKVSVKKKYFAMWAPVIAENETTFLLTDTINGNLSITGLDPGVDIVAINTTLNMSALIYDPNNFYTKADKDYAWSIKSFRTYGTEDNISYNVTQEGPIFINVVVHARVPIKNDTDHVNKWGFFNKVIRALSPVNNISVSGNVYLKQGDVLYLDITCNGTGPYSYCSRLIPPGTPVPMVKNITCEVVTYSQCSFHLQHYFPHTGKYTIVTLIGNRLGLKQSAINIEIYDVSKKPQLSTIIVPIACSLMALIIIIVGLAYHVHQRRSYVIEVADFDFQQPDPLHAKTFMERVKESFKVAYENCGKSDFDHDRLSPEFHTDDDVGRGGEESSGGGGGRSQLLPNSYGACA